MIAVASAAHRAGRIDFDDLQGERRYGQHRAYNQSRLAGTGAVLDSAGRPVRLTGRAADPTVARQLWEVSTALTDRDLSHLRPDESAATGEVL